MSTAPERNIVIIGAGIIGCTTAYYLSHHPSYSASTTKITVLEASVRGAAQGASGKAGGLVAKWAYPKELVSVSFPEHVRLAEQHNGVDRWGWRLVGCGTWEGRGEAIDHDAETGVGADGTRKSLGKTLGLEGSRERKRSDVGLPDDLDWVNEQLTNSYSSMAPAGETAQVHPYLFTTSMLELAKEQGVEFVSGKASAVEVDKSTRIVSGVKFTEPGTSNVQLIPATHVVIAAGAWSPKILPGLPIEGTRAHSITIKPSEKISPYVLFTEITLPPSGSSKHVQQANPEIYARPDNEVYCCGPGDNSAVPETVDDVLVDPKACESLRESVSSISKQLREGAVDRRQACFLPVVSSGGGPIVGEARNVAKGLVIATGHTCWGICNAPGTAKAISELIMGGNITCADLRKLDPARFL
ncbi:hypothetical protein PHLCEN_2v10909 [Hermanssonia centrifuga]|uniref:FAD dependent oxidoreductase domain-containing protein n=1 Tax=Hermanssonia centrifuga TaxID=98765 RepID=A0A2R6NLI7_9APHY|nr:hypothetical protein PHLCEN_2v10909 [Hermanssonia centrifuga]